MLLDWYYKIWVDCIVRFKSIPANKHDWKYKSMLLMSMAMALQFLIFMLLLQKVILRVPLFYKIDVSILPSDKLNYFLDFFILFLMPILLLNYFLIFFNNRYERLIEKYEYHHGKYAIIYMLGTFVGIGLLMLIGFLVKIILG